MHEKLNEGYPWSEEERGTYMSTVERKTTLVSELTSFSKLKLCFVRCLFKTAFCECFPQ
jgi:hypothetical protein